jgi:RNA-directed DNA polymerase
MAASPENPRPPNRISQRPLTSSKTFGYLASFVWRQVMAWLRRKHRKTGWKALRRRCCGGGWWPAEGQTMLLHTGSISTTRYRYRGAAIPHPWQAAG